MAAGTGIAYQIPMEAKLQIPDIPQALGRGMDLQQKQIETQDVVQQHQDQQNDRQVLDQYLKGDGDLYTPEGIEKAKQDLKGKVSVNTYGQIAKQGDALKQHDIEMRQKIAGADQAELKLILDKNNAVLGGMVPLTEAYKIDKEAKGEQEANANFEKNKAQVLQQLSQQKDSQGRPLFAPEQIQQFGQMDYKHLAAAVQVSKPYHDMAETKWKESQTAENLALAKKNAALADQVGKLPVQDKLHLRELDGLFAQGLISKELYESTKAGLLSKATGGVVAANGLTADGQRVMDTMFENGTITAAALRGAKANPVLIDTLNRLGAANADPSATRASFQADTASLRKIVPQYGAIKAFEENTKQQGQILKTLADKVDQTGVPVVERWIRAGRQQVAGDPDVTEFNAQLELYAAESAKILTNPNLSGQLSDTARAEVKAFLPKNATKEQIARVVDRLDKDFTLREKSLEDQIGAINSRIAHKTTVGGGPGSKISPGDQKDRDTDAVPILEKERADEAGRLAAATTPEDKERHTNDLAKLDEELAKARKKSGTASPATKKRVYDPATGTFK